MTIRPKWKDGNEFTLFKGDCADLLSSLPDDSIDLVITSPPYCMGKVYENKKKASDFADDHSAILPEIIRVVKPGGSICWQVGYHVDKGVLTPLDFVVLKIMEKYPQIRLRNRIIWTFGHGLHPTNRFSGRHETVLWFTKGNDYIFNLDEVRVPQKYPGKRGYKGDKKGQFSGNPLGKNPSDVWEIPNVKAYHIEKTGHPCQYPIGLAVRLIKAFSNPGQLVLDPYLGAGTTGAAAALQRRRFVGAEIDPHFFAIAKSRIQQALNGTLAYRADKPVYTPPKNTPLTTVPNGWHRSANEIVSVSPPEARQVQNGCVCDPSEGALRSS